MKQVNIYKYVTRNIQIERPPSNKINLISKYQSLPPVQIPEPKYMIRKQQQVTAPDKKKDLTTPRENQINQNCGNSLAEVIGRHTACYLLFCHNCQQWMKEDIIYLQSFFSCFVFKIVNNNVIQQQCIVSVNKKLSKVQLGNSAQKSLKIFSKINQRLQMALSLFVKHASAPTSRVIIIIL